MVTNTMIGIQVNYQPACFGPTVLACLLIDILWNPPVLRNLLYGQGDILIAGRLCLDINGCSILFKRWAVAWKIFLTLQLTSGHCFPGKQAKAGKEQVESRKPFENVSDSPPSPKIRTSSCWNWAPDISTAGLLIVRRWVKEGEIDTINHQQTWQWGFTVHPVNKSPVSRVSLTNVYIPLLPRYST